MENIGTRSEFNHGNQNLAEVDLLEQIIDGYLESHNQPPLNSVPVRASSKTAYKVPYCSWPK